jgi:hypothetical protein
MCCLRPLAGSCEQRQHQDEAPFDEDELARLSEEAGKQNSVEP